MHVLSVFTYYYFIIFVYLFLLRTLIFVICCFFSAFEHTNKNTVWTDRNTYCYIKVLEHIKIKELHNRWRKLGARRRLQMHVTSSVSAAWEELLCFWIIVHLFCVIIKMMYILLYWCKIWTEADLNVLRECW